MKLSNNLVILEHAVQQLLAFPSPGRVLCTLDDSPHDAERGPEYETETRLGLIQRKVICLQIAKFGHDRFWYYIKTGEELSTVFGLIFEPTGQGVDEYRRIGIAAIPEENGLAVGWDRRVITIV